MNLRFIEASNEKLSAVVSNTSHVGPFFPSYDKLFFNVLTLRFILIGSLRSE